MNERDTEIMGYLARWCLLGLTAMAILTFSAAAVWGTANLVRVKPSQMVMSDAVWVGDDAMEYDIQGLVTPHPNAWEVPIVVLRQPDGTLRLQQFLPDYLRLRLTHPTPGINRLDLVPLPYSRDAMSLWHVDVLTLKPDDRLHLIDSHLLETTTPADPRAFAAMIGHLKTTGHVVYVSPGTGVQFAQWAQRVEEVDPEAIHVSGHRWGKQTVIPQKFLEQTRLVRVKSVILITDQWPTATKAANLGLTVFVISQDPAEADAPANITPFTTLSEFTESLSWSD